MEETISENVLSRPEQKTSAEIPGAKDDLDIDMGNITIEGLKEAVHKLQKIKTPEKEPRAKTVLKHDCMTLLPQEDEGSWDLQISSPDLLFDGHRGEEEEEGDRRWNGTERKMSEP
ncbi:protein o-glcnacase [Plakobranchus ocellatus]|uniref:Protein o-glcnacase n=1 Tax=Plakobranchus ocellatus TaxID=259542 RepID=A0AAV3YI53_9GAST|nr:protein o-glcnacase [Plakobranchus ocellatus]